MKKLISITNAAVGGGICSGKTSGNAHVREKCLDWNIKPVFVPEAARQYFQAVGRGTQDGLTVARAIFQLQLQNEKYYRQRAKELQRQGHRVLTVFDRSLMDSKAYADEQGWQNLLDYFKLTEVEIAKRYTNPIHLVTAADGAEEFYKNDPERPETLEEAKLHDSVAQTIWNGLADHVTIIKNHPGGGIMPKLDDYWYALLGMMGLPVPIEDELWFSVDAGFDPGRITVPCTKVYIEQDYLVSPEHIEFRVRRKNIGSENLFFSTEKIGIPGSNSKREEKERCIDAKRYNQLLTKASPLHERICKYRYCFVYNYQYFELDEFIWPAGSTKPKFKLEFSRTLENQAIEIPNFIPVIADVTGQKEFKTVHLARK